MDYYDISLDDIESIKSKEILQNEYKHTLQRMINFEKFMREKFLFLFISTIFALIAFASGATIEKQSTIYLDFMLYGIFGLIISFGILFYFTHKIYNDLKLRKKKLIKLIDDS